MKRTLAFLISITMALAMVPALPAYAADGTKAYGVMDDESGTFEYFDPEVTVPAKSIKADSLPARYDLRDEGRVTSVKNQYPHNYCWAFAAMSSIESNLITKGIASSSIDLSEGHLAYFNRNGKSASTTSAYAGRDTFSSMSQMANYYQASAGLARGYGIVNESDFPYSVMTDYDVPPKEYRTESLRVKSVYELKDAIFVSSATTTEQYDEAAVNTVKELIMKNGAVASKMCLAEEQYWPDAFGATKPKELIACYYNDIYADHAISIVGWDDDFYSFPGNLQPKGPGAWIVKNSYGTDIHDKGYLYISYYDPSLSQFISFTAQKNSGRKIYQYDGVGIGEWVIKQAGQTSGANCYTARNDVLIDQAMTFTPEAGCKVNFKIYVTKNGKAPTTGAKLYDKTFTQKYSGYSRVDLGKKIAIPKGAKFSAIVTVKTPSGEYFVPFELQDADDPGVFPAVTKSGLSYMLKSGKWKDIDKTTRITDEGFKYRMYNALVKVFGKNSGTKTQKIKVKTKRTVKKGRSIKLKAKRTKGSGRLVYQTSDSSIVQVTAAGTVKGKKKGTAKITVYALPTTTYKSVKKTVTVKVK